MAPSAVLPDVDKREGSAKTGLPANVDRRNPPSNLRLAFWAAIFSAAFLLFFVELLLGKLILPRFGGTPAVWTSCLLVFQVLLLAGYAVAHGVASRFSLRQQGRLMLALLGASLLLFVALSTIWQTPITPNFNLAAGHGQRPALAIIEFLVAAIGFPFLLLSTTSPLLQHWWNRLFADDSPYRLYALSNAGSLLGLLSYPFLIEPALPLRAQARLWTSGYAACAFCFAICAWWAARWHSDDREPSQTSSPSGAELRSQPGVGWQLPALWIALAACASVQLMATTNFICQEVAVIPFLWVLPLCAYLISLILAFDRRRWYSRPFFHCAFVGVSGWLIVLGTNETARAYLAYLVAATLLLFVGCIICHGEAARLRPAPEHLTKFFLCISFGGAAGGVFVSLLAPILFVGYWEFQLGIIACALLLLLAVIRDRTSWWYRGRQEIPIVLSGALLLPAMHVLAQVWPPAGAVPLWMLLVVSVGLIGIAAIRWQSHRGESAAPISLSALRVTVAAAILVLIAGLVPRSRSPNHQVLASLRNFYGAVTVTNTLPDNYLTLAHGATAHGFQFKDPALRKIPTAYYGKHSGANVLISGWPERPMRVGLVGMGAGTLAALGRSGDEYRFYEINPAVAKFSMGPEAYFTYIKDSAAHVELVMGDARMELEREAARGDLQHFDVLVLDAFSSDSIPVHLLTREAFDTYLKHLRSEHSVIAVHITNSALELGPVLAGIANQFNLHALRTRPSWLNGVSSKSDWILLSRDPASLSGDALREISIPFPGTAKPILWTDEYSNLLQLLR